MNLKISCNCGDCRWCDGNEFDRAVYLGTAEKAITQVGLEFYFKHLTDDKALAEKLSAKG